MEKVLEKGEDKIQKICDALRKETLEPAKQEAAKLLEEAHARAGKIVEESKREGEKHLAHAKEIIEQERNVFYSSLEQAAKQTLEELRQAIERKLFREELQHVVEKHLKNEKVIADLIGAMVRAVEKEGIDANLSAVIPQTVSAEEVNALLGDGILKKLKEGKVVLGEFAGGAAVKLHDRKLTIEMTDEALLEVLSNYLRKDFRKLLFKT